MSTTDNANARPNSNMRAHKAQNATSDADAPPVSEPNAVAQSTTAELIADARACASDVNAFPMHGPHTLVCATLARGLGAAALASDRLLADLTAPRAELDAKRAPEAVAAEPARMESERDHYRDEAIARRTESARLHRALEVSRGRRLIAESDAVAALNAWRAAPGSVLALEVHSRISDYADAIEDNEASESSGQTHGTGTSATADVEPSHASQAAQPELTAELAAVANAPMSSADVVRAMFSGPIRLLEALAHECDARGKPLRSYAVDVVELASQLGELERQACREVTNAK